MNVPVWAYDLASRFWATVGSEEPFPRTLAETIEERFAITVKRLPDLTLEGVCHWLSLLRISVEHAADRPLRGCLAATKSAACIFVDANDPPDEQRYSLAHELAHFLRDVLHPRQRVERLLGAAALQVHDRDRGASRDERLVAALEGIELTPHLHFLPRDRDGEPATGTIAEAEDCADVLACELLAPATHLAQRAKAWTQSELVEALVADCGLPRRQAVSYAERLRPPAPRPDPWLQALRASL